VKIELNDDDESSYSYQKDKKSISREIILKVLAEGSKTWQQLLDRTKLSKPALSDNLKELRKQEIITKVIENVRDREKYSLTEKAFKHPILRIYLFETYVYHQILRDLLPPNVIFGSYIKQTEEKRPEDSFFSWDINPEYLKTKTPLELIQVFNYWLTPVTLYTILQEAKSKENIKWTQAITGIIERISNLMIQMDLGKFKEAFETAYSDDLPQRLDSMVELSKRRNIVYDKQSEDFEKWKKMMEGKKK
jgi:DNA-binding transcriptional ArsR family regulator